MTKSFKKVIACLLAVLMVVFSFPFTALAAPGDYAPNIDLIFNAVTNTAGNGIGENFALSGAFNFDNIYFNGYHGAPIDYDKKAGTLTLKADKTVNFAAGVNEAFGEEVIAPLDADKSYGVGDVFSVTFVLNNVDKINMLEAYLNYSNNIEPAGIGNIGTSNIGAKQKYSFVTASEKTEANQDITKWASDEFTAGSFYTSQSMDKLYTVNAILGNQSYVKSDKRIIFLALNTSDASTGAAYTDITTTPEAPSGMPYVNPNTGELGYDWSGNGMILETMFFKITGEGPIKFDVDDKDGSKYGNHNGYQFVYDYNDGTMPWQTTSYSPALNENDFGATKFTFMGTNENAAPTECKHENTEVRNKKEANCTEEGYTGDVYCTDCGELVTEGTKINKLGHDYVPTVTPPTCNDKGYTTYVCSRCNDTYTDDEVDAKGHTPGEAKEEDKVDSTCAKEGSYNLVVRCTECNEIISSEAKTIAKKAHTPAAPVEENRVEPTADKAGSYDEVVYCDVCHEEISRVQKTIEANGVNVTVTASDLGEVEGLAYNVNNLKYGTAYSVTAKPVAGAEFVGWEVNGKLISQSATLSGVAYTDITVTPVFTEADTDTISVIFYDKYANVVAHYDNVTVADFQAEMAKAIPTAPAYPGYVFEKWSMTDDQIKAISKSQTIWATYAEVETGYTVTTDATLTLPENVENGKIPYDAEVTVSAEGATAWVIDGVTVGYGDSYTFFVGSDVTVQPSYEAATVEPKVTIINTTKMTGSHKVNFLATKNVPTGYTLVDYGFVYGKDLTSEELTIENVGKKGAAETAGAVKIVHGYTDGSDQFALNYGITAQQGTAIAKAYVVVKTADGVKVIYSDASAYNYNA